MTDATQIDRKVLDKVRKLMTLANDGGATEGEANAALEAAQAIMAKNNLTMAQLEAAGKSGGEGAARLKSQLKGKAGYSYQQQLMLTVAQTNHCTVLTTYVWKGNRRMATGYALIGREANVAAALGMFDYLNQSLERIVTPFIKGDNTQRLSKAAISFKEGAAQRLQERLSERFYAAQAEQSAAARAQRKAAQATGSGTGLVVVMEDFAEAERHANSDFRHGWEAGTSARKEAEAMTRGQESRKREEERRATLTDEERAAEDAEKAKDYAKWEAKWQKQSDAYWDKKDISAYHAGKRAADQIGLDGQVSKKGADKQIK